MPLAPGKTRRYATLFQDIADIFGTDTVHDALDIATTNVTYWLVRGLAEGVNVEWYRVANRIARELDPTDPYRAAAVLAVLSPRMTWELNVKYARQAYADGTGEHLPCMNQPAQKVSALLCGAPIRETIGNGRKTLTFADNIAYPDTSRHGTLDRWELAIMVGRSVTEEELDILNRKGAYRLLESVLFGVARRFGMSVLQVQSIPWESCRNSGEFSAVKSF